MSDALLFGNCRATFGRVRVEQASLAQSVVATAFGPKCLESELYTRLETEIALAVVASGEVVSKAS